MVNRIIFEKDFRDLVRDTFTLRADNEKGKLELEKKEVEGLVDSYMSRCDLTEDTRAKLVSEVFPEDTSIDEDTKALTYGDFMENLRTTIEKLSTEISVIEKNIDLIRDVCTDGSSSEEVLFSIEAIVNKTMCIDVASIAGVIDSMKVEVTTNNGRKNIKNIINSKIRYIRKIRSKVDRGLYGVSGGNDLNNAYKEFETLKRMARNESLDFRARTQCNNEADAMKETLDSISSVSHQVFEAKANSTKEALTKMLIKYISYSIKSNEVGSIADLDIDKAKMIQELRNAYIIVEVYRFIHNMIPENNTVELAPNLAYRLITFILADRELVKDWCKNILNITFENVENVPESKREEDILPEA